MNYRFNINFINRHKKIIENYFFMTVLQALNSLFYILIYPYLIRILGVEVYGLYIYAISIVTYFIYFVSFGLDFPATKIIAQNIDNKEIYSHTLSTVFTAKIYLQCLSIILFLILIYFIPFLRQNSILFFIVFMQTFSHILFPQWYFQGIQNMRIVTIIQVVFKFLTIPFIFLFVNDSNDLLIFASINSIMLLIGAFIVFFMIRFRDKISINLSSFSEVKIFYKESFPFFLSNSMGIIREQGVTIIIGMFFGMRDVAIYDLANKIVTIPRTLLMSINAALFPKIVNNVSKQKVVKIIKIEFLIGFIVIGFIALFGKIIIKILGGESMMLAYPLTIILSISVLSWLVVGAFISFVFIPNHRFFLVTQNQLLSLCTFISIIFLGFLITKSIFVLTLAISIAGIAEIVYCIYMTRKYKFLDYDKQV